MLFMLRIFFESCHYLINSLTYIFRGLNISSPVHDDVIDVEKLRDENNQFLF